MNINPLLIFIFTPIVAALTARAKVYNMMILGTLIMAAPTFLLALGPTPVNLFAFLLAMSIGEAMWSPRFLQYAAEIAPEGRTGAYMGVAQFPWFLTKVFVPLYSGWFLQRYCPETGPTQTHTMWFIYACIAMGLVRPARPGQRLARQGLQDQGVSRVVSTPAVSCPSRCPTLSEGGGLTRRTAVAAGVPTGVIPPPVSLRSPHSAPRTPDTAR